MASKRKRKQEGSETVPLPQAAEQAPPQPSESKRVTPVEIQQKEFRVAFRGYNERDVDVFLDEVTEEVSRLFAENKRLREELELRGSSVLPGVEEADDIVRQARAEADRILADARAGAKPYGEGALPGSGAPDLTPEEAATSRVLIGAFLAREREFLQTLAGLIQDHAQGVKDNAAEARDQITAASAGSAAESPPPEARPVPDAGQAGPAGQAAVAAAAVAASAATARPAAADPARSQAVAATTVPAPASMPRTAPADRPTPPPPPPPRVVPAAEPEPSTKIHGMPETRDAGGPAEAQAMAEARPAEAQAMAEARPTAPSTLLDVSQDPEPGPEPVAGSGSVAGSESVTGSEPAIERPVRAPATPVEPAPVPGMREAAGPEPEDRSIQELFWGEI